MDKVSRRVEELPVVIVWNGMFKDGKEVRESRTRAEKRDEEKKQDRNKRRIREGEEGWKWGLMFQYCRFRVRVRVRDEDSRTRIERGEFIRVRYTNIIIQTTDENWNWKRRTKNATRVDSGQPYFPTTGYLYGEGSGRRRRDIICKHTK